MERTMTTRDATALQKAIMKFVGTKAAGGAQIVKAVQPRYKVTARAVRLAIHSALRQGWLVRVPGETERELRVTVPESSAAKEAGVKPAKPSPLPAASGELGTLVRSTLQRLNRFLAQQEHLYEKLTLPLLEAFKKVKPGDVLLLLGGKGNIASSPARTAPAPTRASDPAAHSRNGTSHAPAAKPATPRPTPKKKTPARAKAKPPAKPKSPPASHKGSPPRKAATKKAVAPAAKAPASAPAKPAAGKGRKAATQPAPVPSGNVLDVPPMVTLESRSKQKKSKKGRK